MRQIRVIFLSLLLASGLVLAVSYFEETTTELPGAILAKERKNESQNTEVIQGFPEAIEGVWQYTNIDGSVQTLTLFGNQLTVHTEETGRVYYDNIVTHIQKDSTLLASPSKEQTYSFSWDINEFIRRYGEGNLSANPQAFVLSYNQDSDQLSASSTIQYQRNKGAEKTWRIMQKLKETLPMNDLQLAKIDQDVLLDLWDASQQKNLDGVELTNYLYKGIQAQYPELDLISLNDLEAYQLLVSDLMKASDLSFVEINEAGAKEIFTRYQALSDEGNDHPELNVIETLLAEIKEWRETYQRVKFNQENEEVVITE